MQDHIEGSVPGVISSQGNNPSPLTEPGVNGSGRDRDFEPSSTLTPLLNSLGICTS